MSKGHKSSDVLGDAAHSPMQMTSSVPGMPARPTCTLLRWLSPCTLPRSPARPSILPQSEPRGAATAATLQLAAHDGSQKLGPRGCRCGPPCIWTTRTSLAPEHLPGPPTNSQPQGPGRGKEERRSPHISGRLLYPFNLRWVTSFTTRQDFTVLSQQQTLAKKSQNNLQFKSPQEGYPPFSR